ncbi:hypothetical protein [Campylobacter sp. RM16187]|uniref:hypothetical protein n=1 Tax=Campylobacter sp. RM16187 TaxID=1660063 RepID=UPI0021B64458|nr:hypothetical protein [Campylobacter sp. RM16187]QKG30255.1 hypothetical protein CDOMF_a006 [Campylobacter sp. RM16187]
MLNKKTIIFISILVVAIVGIAFLIKPDNSESVASEPKTQNVSAATSPAKTDNQLTDGNGTFIPPKMEINPFAQNLASDKDEAIKSSAKVDADEPKVSDMTNYENARQEDAIKQISKMQKPNDMIAFLKEKQSEFQFNAKEKSFKFDLKEYAIGDKFLDFFEITDVGSNFIRFKDDGYEYNLRFIKD